MCLETTAFITLFNMISGRARLKVPSRALLSAECEREYSTLSGYGARH